MTEPIISFDGSNRFLSNFYKIPVKVGGIIYPTSEHAYQAQKTIDIVKRKDIAKLQTASQAKRAGRILVCRNDWDKVKVRFMKLIVYQKFLQNTQLAELLIATNDAELIEGNWWGDRFWGVCEGAGKNHLGIILMIVRDRLN